VNVAVIGAGLAGTSAAWRAARAGHSVTIVHAGAGSSELYSGALDLAPWESAPEHEHLPSAVLEFGKALGWALSAEQSARVATRAGLIRPARGRDRSVLDLAPLRGKRIGVADLERDDWDARSLAAGLGECPWAAATRTRFEAVAVAGLRNGSERRISSYDFARLHDDPERAGFLAAELARANPGVEAWLVGPWLGVEQDLAARLTVELRLPVGETLSPPGGPAGARFELARARLLGRLGILARKARALRVSSRAVAWQIDLDSSPSPLAADAVVLALGGVAAGGVCLTGSPSGGPERGFEVSLEAPVELELDGRAFESSTLFGEDLAARGLELLERIGVSVDDQGAVRGVPGLFAAGDFVAGQPRTALSAVIQGLCAAESAVSRG